MKIVTEEVLLVSRFSELALCSKTFGRGPAPKKIQQLGEHFYTVNSHGNGECSPTRNKINTRSF